LKILLVGDLILDEPDPDSFFDRTRPLLQSADLVVGHVEVPHTTRGVEASSDVPAPPSDPAHLLALGRAGFHVATLAGNHIFDAGPNGVADTVASLRSQGIQTTGAGSTLDEARQPAIVERHGLHVGVLSYNCVGPKDSWATRAKAGCAYVHVITHYELDHASPGGPPRIYTFAEPETLEAMQRDIAALEARVDLVVVALHKGIGHTPAALAMYERQVAKAAIGAGADIVVGHHAHITRGVEIYRGRPVFHGLGNFVTVTRALNVEANASPARLAWAKRRQELFGFEPDPAYPTYPFHPEAKNAMIGVCEAGAGGVTRAGFVPCWIQPSGAPEPLAADARGVDVARYIEAITARAGLGARFTWEDDVVWFGEEVSPENVRR
jgi:poly-gamma-glutamate synthesis protein (capsule biosynthesis protein)